MINDKTKGRIFASFQFLLILIVVISSYFENLNLSRTSLLSIRILSVVLLLLSFLVLILALVSFGQRITPSPVPLENTQLRTTGIYSIIRHPMYCFALLFLLGFILYFDAYFSLTLIILAFIFLVFKIRFEEKQLVRRFPEYIEYKKHTKKLIPFIY